MFRPKQMYNVWIMFTKKVPSLAATIFVCYRNFLGLRAEEHKQGRVREYREMDLNTNEHLCGFGLFQGRKISNLAILIHERMLASDFYSFVFIRENLSGIFFSSLFSLC